MGAIRLSVNFLTTSFISTISESNEICIFIFLTSLFYCLTFTYYHLSTPCPGRGAHGYKYRYHLKEGEAERVETAKFILEVFRRVDPRHLT